MAWAVLGLGGNLGSRRALLGCARELLAGQPGLTVLASSPLYRTAPLISPQPEYLNAALRVEWPGSARALLSVCQQIEQLLQRQRLERWGSRTLDIDLLYWSEGEIAEPGLSVPHPGLAERLFARVPLLDVAPELSSRFLRASWAEERAFAPSEPFVARAERTPEGARTTPTHDPCELLAALPSALASLAQGASRTQAVLPFVVPCAGWPPSSEQLEFAISALISRVDGAFRAGFRVAAGAISGVGEGRLSGVFVGQHDPASRSLPVLRYACSRGPEGATVSIMRT